MFHKAIGSRFWENWFSDPSSRSSPVAANIRPPDPTNGAAAVVAVPSHWYYAEFTGKYGQDWPKVGNNQLFNANLKRLAEKAGISQPVTRRVNRGGQNAWETSPKHELIHQYTLRYSFATNLDAAGVAIQDIMRLMGHTNIKTTIRYIKTKAQQSAIRVASNAYFTTKPATKAS